MENCSIPNSNPATGRTSTPSSPQLKKLSKRPAYLSSDSVRRWMLATTEPVHGEGGLDVGHLPRRNRAKAGSMFSSPRRVKGAWWPSRSSKPLLVPRTRDRGRFDSYPLRQFCLFPLPVAAALWTTPLKSRIQDLASSTRKGGEWTCRASRFVN